MFEELIEPCKDFLGVNKHNYPYIDKEEFIVLYNENLFQDLLLLKNEFFKSDAWKLYNGDDEKWEEIHKKTKNDFLKLHPNCCNELIELFWWDYFYCLWKDGGI